ncbi:hypothetical protein EDC56_2566 [Sinobacterium caligoides]|uniref:Uncharacterized protein n=1 Tax=Sinobacterium caligoides TaxID=933926 RepID=A0A3N2DJU0_9GAMM|nr:hypothetical protein [Sinobacterium caligoides]ROR99931.1 hypothetical protein EDC56_2566 [Sinobacterium caligoides]
MLFALLITKPQLILALKRKRTISSVLVLVGVQAALSKNNMKKGFVYER